MTNELVFERLRETKSFGVYSPVLRQITAKSSSYSLICMTVTYKFVVRGTDADLERMQKKTKNITERSDLDQQRAGVSFNIHHLNHLDTTPFLTVISSSHVITDSHL